MVPDVIMYEFVVYFSVKHSRINRIYNPAVFWSRHDTYKMSLWPSNEDGSTKTRNENQIMTLPYEICLANKMKITCRLKDMDFIFL